MQTTNIQIQERTQRTDSQFHENEDRGITQHQRTAADWLIVSWLKSSNFCFLRARTLLPLYFHSKPIFMQTKFYTADADHVIQNAIFLTKGLYKCSALLFDQVAKCCSVISNKTGWKRFSLWLFLISFGNDNLCVWNRSEKWQDSENLLQAQRSSRRFLQGTNNTPRLSENSESEITLHRHEASKRNFHIVSKVPSLPHFVSLNFFNNN